MSWGVAVEATGDVLGVWREGDWGRAVEIARKFAVGRRENIVLDERYPAGQAWRVARTIARVTAEGLLVAIFRKER